MNWLVDAQLPARLAQRLRERGEDAIHTLDLPDGNRTTDAVILAVAARDDRIVVTKDADFRHTHTVSGSPASLLLVRTGNIRNDELIELFSRRLADIGTAFAGASFVELHRDVLIVHADGPRT